MFFLPRNSLIDVSRSEDFKFYSILEFKTKTFHSSKIFKLLKVIHL